MRNFFAKSVLAAAILTLVPVASFASDARIGGLGLQGDYVQDYTNIYNYPASIVRYTNLAYGNWGIKDVSGGDVNGTFEDNNATPSGLVNSNRSMGAYLSICKKLPGTWGVQVNENQNPISPAYGAQYYDRSRNEGVTLLWGDKIGAKSAIGFTLDRAGSHAEDANDVIAPFEGTGTIAITAPITNARDIMNQVNQGLGQNDPRNSWCLGAGWSTSWSSHGRDHMAELGVHYRNNTLHVEDKAAGTLLEDNGNAAYAVNARLQCAVSDNSYLTPVFNWYSIDRGTKLTDTTTPANNFNYENKISSINLGLAETWVLHETDMLVMGVSYNREKVDYKDPTIIGDPFTITYAGTPTIFTSLEVHPTHWWHLRMGAGKPVWSKLEITDNTSNTTTTIKDSPLQYAVGTGFRLGSSLDIDAVVNQNFAFTGGWAASGFGEVPFSSLSATYRF